MTTSGGKINTDIKVVGARRMPLAWLVKKYEPFVESSLRWPLMTYYLFQATGPVN
jgi:hypothetical protein